ncbi:calponin homology domain-containing protein [Mucilaginibacter ginsenosidivorans]|uniref:Uncharacterized protein n=1 Tax=Mucilaginibacter ginsenosidivorans TaxID=398053 RepID=A0A5B8UV31_9SPHI|nr:hypothetical protein [Mucilaginibacter ginsenosidivorans]QEC62759.1 hypothetical protein FRZ54_09215 [Mucilaginibacter ginsenosidivorans]
MKILTYCIIPVILLFLLSIKIQAQAVKPTDNAALFLKKRTDSISNYILKHNKRLIIFAKIPNKKNPVRVIGDKWPDDAEYSYNILKDSAGRVIFIAEMPYSESGDWYIEYRHYFDNSGNTVAFKRITNVFDNDVKDGVIYETLTNYYLPNLKLKDKIYTLTSKDGKNIKNNGHVDVYHYPYHIYKNANECLEAYHIVLNK